MMIVTENLPEFIFLEVGDFVIQSSNKRGRIIEVIGDRKNSIELYKSSLTVTGVYSSFVGGMSSCPSTFVSNIVGGTCNTICYYSNIIGGTCNVTPQFSVLGGCSSIMGGYNTTSSYCSVNSWYIRYKVMCDDGLVFEDFCYNFQYDRQANRDFKINSIIGSKLNQIGECGNLDHNQFQDYISTKMLGE